MNLVTKALLPLIFLLFSFSVFSQEHHLIDTLDFEKRNAIIKDYEHYFDNLQAELKKTYSGKLRKEIQKIYTGLEEEFLDVIKKERLIFSVPFQDYLDSIQHVISANNPLLEKENISLFLSKSPNPNAYALGNGIVVLNIGLFNFLENDDQLATVITHEISHQLLEHSKKGIQHIAKNNLKYARNSDFSLYLKRDKYNRSTKALIEFKQFLYEDSDMSKSFETEADSLGFSLYRNSGFKDYEFINALENMAILDSIPAKIIDSMVYKNVFDLPNQPFKKDWLRSENFADYDYDLFEEKINLDSIKSHPEIENRIAYLNELYVIANQDTITHNPSEQFLHLKKISSEAQVENMHYLNEYGWSVYIALYKINLYGMNDYYRFWLGKNFEAMHNAKKSYQLNRYVDRVSPKDQSESYQLFLNFIWNLSLNELSNISEFYLNEVANN